MDTFIVRPKVYYGENSLNYLQEINVKKAFIVTDEMMVEIGIVHNIVNQLKNTSCKVFSAVEQDPSIETVQKGLTQFLEQKPEVIIAVGGGSPIDVAKAILLFFNQLQEKIPTEFEWERPQFVAIPTTSGTGSEVTSYSVVTDKKNEVKIPLNDEIMYPDVAILDENLTKTVPPSVTADTGMDTLTHALEAYVSAEATEFSDLYAEEAIRRVFKYLLRAYRFGGDLEARGKLHIASCMAGIAFTNSSLGITHSLAHAIGAKYHFSHGRSNAILLPYIIQYNGGVCDGTVQTSQAAKKYMKIARMLGLPSTTAEEGIMSLSTAVKLLNQKLGIPLTFKNSKIDESCFEKNIPIIVEDALKDKCTAGNPKLVNQMDLVYLLKWTYTG